MFKTGLDQPHRYCTATRNPIYEIQSPRHWRARGPVLRHPSL